MSNKENETFDIDNLDNIDFSTVDKRVEEMQEGGGVIAEVDNSCGDSCTI